MIRFLAAVTLAVVFVSSPAAADGPPPPIPPTAVRLDLAFLEADQPANPIPGDCDSYHDIAIAAGWTEADWPTLRTIIQRESHCQPGVVNRYGCVGLTQVCRINHARLGVTRTDLQDAATNLAIARQLCQEWVDAGRSCWRPWWTRRFRP
jgi:hypothetical protein